MNKKTAALLAIALLISLAGCGGTSGVDDVPPSNSTEPTQAPSEAVETAPGTIESTDPAQDPSQSEGPSEAVRDPAQSEGPAESETPTAQPTKQPEQTASPSAPSAAPVPTSPPAPSAPSSAPTSTSTPTPVHTHNYTSTITKQATCGIDGVRTYNCSCGDSYTEVIKATGNHNYSSTVTKQATCAEEGVKTFTCSTCGNMYNEAIAKTNDHNWTVRHVDEVGHYASTGTHEVTFIKCSCGFYIDSDNPSWKTLWKEHSDPNTGCLGFYAYGTKMVSDGEPQYIIDSPAYDETYCTICGTTQ